MAPGGLVTFASKLMLCESASNGVEGDSHPRSAFGGRLPHEAHWERRLDGSTSLWRWA